MLLLKTGAISRFSDVGSVHVSNGKKKNGGNTKNGNRVLAWAHTEAANFAIRYREAAKKFYQRKKAKLNATVATKAVARKLAKACCPCLRQENYFEWSAA